MRIRNDHPVARLVPSQRLLVPAGAELDWPARTPIPDGFSVVEPPTRGKKTKPPATDTQEP